MDAVLLVTVLRFTVPAFAADTAATADPCRDSMPLPSNVSRVNLYGAPRYWSGHDIPYWRSHDVTPGQADTFVVISDSPGWSWFVEAETPAGFKSCWAGISVGIPPTSVPPTDPESGPWFDIAGRRLPGAPNRPGIYLHGGRVVRVL